MHRIPQIEIADAGACDDPRRDADPACGAPPVYVRNGDPATPASTATFATLPVMYAEGLAGANASYFWNARAHLGMTGYGSFPRWLVQGAELGFQEFSRKPFGGPFGAVGVDAAFGFRAQDFFAEVARSFDAQVAGGGGYGAIVRSVTTLSTTEVDVSARYYGSEYANPYARPVSAPAELDGLRGKRRGWASASCDYPVWAPRRIAHHRRWLARALFGRFRRSHLRAHGLAARIRMEVVAVDRVPEQRRTTLCPGDPIGLRAHPAADTVGTVSTPVARREARQSASPTRHRRDLQRHDPADRPPAGSHPSALRLRGHLGQPPTAASAMDVRRRRAHFARTRHAAPPIRLPNIPRPTRVDAGTGAQPGALAVARIRLSVLGTRIHPFRRNRLTSE